MVTNMTFVPISNQHKSPFGLNPALSQKQVNTGTWGGGGNTCVITDSEIHLNSDFRPWVTGTTPSSGNWSWTCAEGSVTITSSDSENSGLTISYLIY